MKSRQLMGPLEEECGSPAEKVKPERKGLTEPSNPGEDSPAITEMQRTIDLTWRRNMRNTRKKKKKKKKEEDKEQVTIEPAHQSIKLPRRRDENQLLARAGKAAGAASIAIRLIGRVSSLSSI